MSDLNVKMDNQICPCLCLSHFLLCLVVLYKVYILLLLYVSLSPAPLVSLLPPLLGPTLAAFLLGISPLFPSSGFDVVGISSALSSGLYVSSNHEKV